MNRLVEQPLQPAAFHERLALQGIGPLARAARIETVQVNVGKLCNQACHHCHVEAGPKRPERMTRATAERILRVIEASRDLSALDITGGAPELNENFPFLVGSVRSAGLRVIDRCNLTVLLEPGMHWLPQFLAEQRVEVVCSLPCYTAANVDQQRGRGVFDKSIAALRLLNSLGYGQAGSGLVLDLVYNPLGAFLPPEQAQLESRFREELRNLFGIEFHRLLTITNMPIKRFAEQLRRERSYNEYLGLLVNHFNPSTVPGLMCRSQVSVGWDGHLYDCDFNQMLELPLRHAKGSAHIRTIGSFDTLAGGAIETGIHCFGCTAGSGSSCGGALDG